MMNQPLVSICLATYNVGEFVSRTINCVLSQTYLNFELICIDDASTDNTFAILQDFAIKDSRIKLYKHDFNQGLSVSRNESIELAQGEYFTCIDGDDLAPLDWLETVVARITNSQADMVIWDYCPFYNEEDLPMLCIQESALKNIRASDRHALSLLPGFMAIRMFKLESLRALSTPFPIGCTKQDLPLHWRAITKLDRIELIPRKMCYYRQRPGATSMRKGKSLFSLYKVMDIVGENLKQDNVYDEYRDDYLTQRLQLLQGMYDFILPEFKDEALSIIKTKCAESDVNLFLDTKLHLLSKRTQLFFRMIRGSFIAKLQYKGFLLLRDIYRKVKKG